MKVGDRVGYLIEGIVMKGTVIELFPVPDNNPIKNKAYVKFDYRWHPSLSLYDNSYDFTIDRLIELENKCQIFSVADPYGEEIWED